MNEKEERPIIKRLVKRYDAVPKGWANMVLLALIFLIILLSFLAWAIWTNSGKIKTLEQKHIREEQKK